MSSSEGRLQPPSEGRLYVIATVHLDTQWRWTIQDTIRDFIPATLERNFDLLERYPFFVVSFEGAFRYQLMKEYYPDQFTELARWVDAGRWRLAGSMLDSPDVNIVAPESLIRQVLYGNGFFQREFGQRSEDLFLPDCFGFGWATPSVAAHCGLEGFSGQKFGRWMAPAEIPFEVGVWQGPDGEEIVAAIRPEGYGEGLSEDLSLAPRFRQRLAATGRSSGAFVGIKYVGVGDRGGGLDEDSMQWLSRSVAGQGPVEVVVSGSDQIFRDLDARQMARLPRHRGELLLPTHGTGCLTSQARLKRWNRRNESLGDAAERAAVMADSLNQQPYPGRRLEQAWTRFLWHQMHDDLTGTSIPAAYEFTDNDLQLSLHQFATVLTQSVGAVTSQMDTRGSGQSVAVFNPLSIHRHDVVGIDLPATGEPITSVRVLGPDGTEVPSQLAGGTGSTGQTVLILADMPPLGIRIFDLQLGREARLGDPDLEVDHQSLSNHRYRVELDDQGDVLRVFDRRTDRQLLADPIRWQLLRDRSARWPAWEILYEDLLEPDPETVSGPAEIQILEAGPVRVSLEVVRRGRRSTFRQVLRLAGGGAGQRFEIDNEVLWRTGGRMLKASFRPANAGPTALYDLGLGIIERGNNTPQKYEVPAQQWAALPAAERAGGLSILNDCKYGWDKPDDRTLRLTLLRSPRVIRKFRHQGRQDHGLHRFTYSLLGHTDDWQPAESSWQAARINQPLSAFFTPHHPGRLGKEYSWLRLSSDQIGVQTLKRAEQQGDWIVRIRELSGRPATAVSLETNPPLGGAAEVNGMEDEIGPVQRQGSRLSVDLSPFAIRSLALKPRRDETAPPAEQGLTLDLPFDRSATRVQGQADPGGFDGRGNSIPAEIWPAELELGGVLLRLGSNGPEASNALSCRGQRVPLPVEGHDRLHILATAVPQAMRAEVTIGRRRQRLEVPAWAGFLARRKPARRRGFSPADDDLIASPAPYEVAWIGTHLHDAGGDDRPYVFCYLFRYSLELPVEARELVLPEASGLHLFAATMATSGNREVAVAHPLYD